MGLFVDFPHCFRFWTDVDMEIAHQDIFILSCLGKWFCIKGRNLLEQTRNQSPKELRSCVHPAENPTKTPTYLFSICLWSMIKVLFLRSVPLWSDCLFVCDFTAPRKLWRLQWPQKDCALAAFCLQKVLWSKLLQILFFHLKHVYVFFRSVCDSRGPLWSPTSETTCGAWRPTGRSTAATETLRSSSWRSERCLTSLKWMCWKGIGCVTFKLAVANELDAKRLLANG